MSRKYFGTDGIRGRVGKYPMTPDFVLKLGWAVGKVLASNGNSLVLIGKDTRISGYMLESALHAGLVAAGVNIRLLGPMPTPAVAYLTRTFRAAAGIVISASHNPYYDNGLKFFSAQGLKLADEVEEEIEYYLEQDFEVVPSASLGKAERMIDAAGRYIEFCKRSLPATSGATLKNIRIVVDCANGATYHVAPNVFEELGAEVIPICHTPNGLNINEKCGATALGTLQQSVKEYRADIGIALDGDGDRLMLVDHKSEIVDGDEALLIIAILRQQEGTLGKGQGVVGTKMSNLGLEQAIQKMGLTFYRADVGDRYVMQIMREKNCILGGEASGHIIIKDRIATGDGIIAALEVLRAMINTGKTLHQIKKSMTKYPQVLINVPLKQKIDLANNDKIQQAIASVEEQLGNRGRVLLRTSGTEPLIRVMVEGDDKVETQKLAQFIADIVKKSQS